MKQLAKKILLLSLIAVPAIVFYALFFKYTVDVPINDDYKAILDFMNSYIEATSQKQKLQLLFAQHNEHRIVYDRIWTLICFKVNGLVNFNFLALMGNLSLIGIFAVFYRAITKISSNLLYLLPISVLIFNIAFYENMTFAMATLSNLTAVLFSLLCLYFLSSEKLTIKHVVLSLTFFVFSVFTMGSGLFIIPIIIAILLYRKERKFLIIYGVVILVTVAGYFYGYSSPQHHPKVLDTLIDFKVRALLFALAYLGNAFNYYLISTNEVNESIGITAVLGFAFLLLYFYIAKTKYYKKNLFVFSVLTMVVIGAFISGVTRCQFGLDTAGASRYRISGAVFAIALFMWFIDTRELNSKKLNFLVLAGSVLYFFFININLYEYLSFRQRASLFGVINYHSGDYSKLNGFEHELYNQTIVKSYQYGSYYLPSYKSLESFFPYSKPQPPETPVLNPNNATYSIDAITKLKDSYYINGYIFLDKLSAEGQKVFIGLKSVNNGVNFYSAYAEPRFDLNPYFNSFRLLNAGFNARIKFSDLAKGNYKILIKLINKNGDVRIVETDKTLDY